MEIENLKSVWERLGEKDPMWAVLTNPEKRGRRWDAEEFFATGRDHATWAKELLGRIGLDFGEHLLDFGCGLGRLSNAFAGLGHRVDGVDIAASMIEGARQHNQYPDRITFTSYPGGVLPFADDTFDGVITLIVLQHIPPQPKLVALAELIRVTKPGGLLLFQTVDQTDGDNAPLSTEDSRAQITVKQAPKNLIPGEIAVVRAEITNHGQCAWSPAADIKLGNHWYRDGECVVLDDGRAPLQVSLEPNDSVELELQVRAPAEPGEYVLRLDMVQEFIRWFADAGSDVADLAVTVGTSAPSTEDAQPLSVPSGVVAQDSEGIEMHPMPDALIRAVADYLDTDVVHCERDGHGGPDWLSRTYVLRVRD